MHNDIFANRLKALRMSRRLTLQNLGDIVGCNRQNISNLENARVSPSIGMAVALADFFGVSLDYLVGRTNNPETVFNSDGGEPAAPETEKFMEKKKLIWMIDELDVEDTAKAMSYVTFLNYTRQNEKR